MNAILGRLLDYAEKWWVRRKRGYDLAIGCAEINRRVQEGGGFHWVVGTRIRFRNEIAVWVEPHSGFKDVSPPDNRDNGDLLFEVVSPGWGRLVSHACGGREEIKFHLHAR